MLPHSICSLQMMCASKNIRKIPLLLSFGAAKYFFLFENNRTRRKISSRSLSHLIIASHGEDIIRKLREEKKISFEKLLSVVGKSLKSAVGKAFEDRKRKIFFLLPSWKIIRFLLIKVRR